MTAEDNKAIVKRLVEELWNAGNPELADQLYSADYVRHGPYAEPPIRGSEALKKFASMYLSAVPDLRHEIEDQFAREDSVVSRATARGTHRGEMMGIAPTGKPIVFSMFLQHRMASGKIVEEWVMYDLHGILQQVGAGG
jgi:steroid delta-isomerase-like uncharacterized protein